MSYNVHIKKKENDNTFHDIIIIPENEFVHEFFTQRGYARHQATKLNRITLFVFKRELQKAMRHEKDNDKRNEIQAMYTIIDDAIRRHIEKDDLLYYVCS